MPTPDQMLGVVKPDMQELKEVKLKLPMQQLLRLHFLKMTARKTFSAVVDEALAEYFEARGVGAQS